MWFIFISARRFYAGTALPSCLAAWTGTWPLRREPLNSTGGTLTHEFAHPSRAAAGWPVYSTNAATPSFFLFFSGAGQARLSNCPPAAPLKNKKKGCGSWSSYK